MTEEVVVEQDPVAVSEQPVVESVDEEQEQEPKMVPLAAMLATRKKAQEADIRAAQAEARAEVYREAIQNAKEQKPVEPKDPNALVEAHQLDNMSSAMKREILETLYQQMNPEAVQKIDKYLEKILEKKPWLKATIDTSLNRYAQASEIVEDYVHLVEPKPVVRQAATNDAKRIIANSEKPRSPSEIGKSAQPGGTDYLKSIQGKKEFREYRQKLLHG